MVKRDDFVMAMRAFGGQCVPACTVVLLRVLAASKLNANAKVKVEVEFK